MTGLVERTAVSLLSALVARGLLRSDTVQGKVRFGLPLHVLRFISRRCGLRLKPTWKPSKWRELYGAACVCKVIGRVTGKVSR